MATLQELQKQIKKLREENERKQRMLTAKVGSQRDMARIQAEKKRLQAEIKALQNPKSTAFKKNLGKGLRKGGRITLSILRTLNKAAQEYDKPKRRTPRKKSKSRKNR